MNGLSKKKIEEEYALARRNFATVMDGYIKAINSALMTPNEVRDRLEKQDG